MNRSKELQEQAGLAERLQAAEDLCVMYAWSPSRHDSDRDKAAHELWLRWMDVSGNRCTTEENPHLTDELIAGLAAKRDATRNATLQRIFTDLEVPGE
jgi:hypothetical protein